MEAHLKKHKSNYTKYAPVMLRMNCAYASFLRQDLIASTCFYNYTHGVNTVLEFVT